MSISGIFNDELPKTSVFTSGYAVPNLNSHESCCLKSLLTSQSHRVQKEDFKVSSSQLCQMCDNFNIDGFQTKIHYCHFAQLSTRRNTWTKKKNEILQESVSSNMSFVWFLFISLRNHAFYYSRNILFIVLNFPLWTFICDTEGITYPLTTDRSDRTWEICCLAAVAYTGHGLKKSVDLPVRTRL